jgi:hypothetical protein
MRCAEQIVFMTSGLLDESSMEFSCCTLSNLKFVQAMAKKFKGKGPSKKRGKGGKRFEPDLPEINLEDDVSI